MNQTSQVPEWSTQRDPHDPLAPPPPHTELQRSGCPIGRVKIWDGSEPWLVTTHQHYRTVAADPRFSSDRSTPGYPLKNAGYQTKEKTFLTMDDPEHLPYKRLWTQHLSARAMEKLRPSIQLTVDRAIDDLSAGPQLAIEGSPLPQATRAAATRPR